MSKDEKIASLEEAIADAENCKTDKAYKREFPVQHSQLDEFISMAKRQIEKL